MPPESAVALAATAHRQRLRIADVALFYGERSGGIRTYLEAKAAFAARTGAFEHHLVIPGRPAHATANPTAHPPATATPSANPTVPPTATATPPATDRHHDPHRHEQPSLRLAASNGYRIPLGGAGLQATLRELAPDIVLLHDPYWTPRLASRAAHQTGAAVIAVHHSSAALHAAGLPGPQGVYKRALRRWYRRAYVDVDAVMSVVDPGPDAHRPSTLLLRLGLDQAFHPRPEIVRGDHVLYVGRLSREKGLRELLEAAAAITLLVIPAADLHPIGARAPALAAWLRGRVACGDAVAQHGLAHKAAAVVPWPRSVLAGWQGGAAAEFLASGPMTPLAGSTPACACSRRSSLTRAGSSLPGTHTRGPRATCSPPRLSGLPIWASRQRRRALCVHLPGDSAVPTSVVLGLVLSRDRLAPFRPRASPSRVAHAGPGRPARRLYDWMRHDRTGHFWLIERYRRLSYDVAMIAERYEEHVEDVAVNVFYALGCRALARLDHEHGSVYAERAERTEAALLERCYDERTGLFFDLAGTAERPLRTSTWSALAPLALRSLPEDVRRRLVDEHLLDPRRYRADWGIPSVAIESPRFTPDSRCGAAGAVHRG